MVNFLAIIHSEFIYLHSLVTYFPCRNSREGRHSEFIFSPNITKPFLRIKRRLRELSWTYCHNSKKFSDVSLRQNNVPYTAETWRRILVPHPRPSRCRTSPYKCIRWSEPVETAFNGGGHLWNTFSLLAHRTQRDSEPSSRYSVSHTSIENIHACTCVMYSCRVNMASSIYFYM